jgi:ribosomal protein S18 acetylase RimI-like enzyme
LSDQFNAYTLRTAVRADLPRLNRLLANSGYVHSQLDWWTLNDWIGSPAFIVAASGHGAVAGLSLAACDGSPVAWWRALALNVQDDPSALVHAILEPTLAGLRSDGAVALTCLAFSDWLQTALQALAFRLLTQVITLRKGDRRLPALDQEDILIRPAHPADLPGVLAADQAAFDPTWRYGPRTLARLHLKMKPMIVAERDGQVIGYACGDVNGFSGHIVRLAVHPAHQRRNAGALLLDAMIQSFFASGAQAVTLNTQIDNHPSQRLYRRFAFRPIGDVVDVWQRPLEQDHGETGQE